VNSPPLSDRANRDGVVNSLNEKRVFGSASEVSPSPKPKALLTLNSEAKA